MRDFSNNTECAPLTPTAFREALRQMQAMCAMPVPVCDRLYLNANLGLDWERLVLEVPGVAQSIRLSQKENNGEVILPPAVYHDLLARGLLVWADDGRFNFSVMGHKALWSQKTKPTSSVISRRSWPL